MELTANIRQSFIDFQRQYYNESEAYDLIAQSDQNKAILTGKYDEFISKKFDIKLIPKNDTL